VLFFFERRSPLIDTKKLDLIAKKGPLDLATARRLSGVEQAAQALGVAPARRVSRVERGARLARSLRSKDRLGFPAHQGLAQFERFS
jgi:hypothetical protein